MKLRDLVRSKRALNVLRALNALDMSREEGATRLTERDILLVKGSGRKTLSEIRKAAGVQFFGGQLQLEPEPVPRKTTQSPKMAERERIRKAIEALELNDGIVSIATVLEIVNDL